MKSVYENYFAKNKPFRHYTQHLLVASLGLILIHSFSLARLSPAFLTLYFFSTYLIDLDGLTYVFLRKRNKKHSKLIINEVKKLNFIKAAEYATTYHKSMNKLIVHNILGYLIFLSLFFIGININSSILIAISTAVIAHFTFDIFDDLYQMGHLKNWLWMVQKT